MPEFHAEYGGSNAERWLFCAGSTQLLRQVPRSPTNPAAERGTALHAAAEHVLLNDVEPETLLGVTIKGIKLGEPEIKDLRIAIDSADAIAACYSKDAYIVTETFATFLRDKAGNVISGGTFDIGIADGKRGAIIDFKFGSQDIIEPSADQLLFYAIAARDSIPEFAKVEEWDCWVIQPAMDPAHDKVTYPNSVLDRRREEQLIAIRLAEAPNPSYTEGEWCEYCDAKLSCPAKLQRLSTLTAPNHTMDLKDIGAQLAKWKSWTKWMEEAEKRLHHELEHGNVTAESIGWKLVMKRGKRVWKNEAEAIGKFKALKVPETSYMITEVISPYQAEQQRLLPKKEVEALAHSVSSGTTIAPIDDKRSPVIPIAALDNALRHINKR